MDQTRLVQADGARIRPMPVDTSTVIEVGDLLWLDTDDVKPATDQASAADETTAKQNFADNFAGVAMDSSEDDEDHEIAVATAGIFVFPTESSGTHNPYDLLSVNADANGDILDDQQLEATTTNSEALAFVHEFYGSSTSIVKAELIPIIMTRLSAF